MPLTEKQVPWTGPYSLAGNTQGNPSKGPTCEALKRALSRAGAPQLPWQEFDQHFNKKLEAALDWYDKKVGAIPGNGYGKGRWTRLRAMRAQADGPHAGEYALDDYGRKLIQDEAHETADSDELYVLQKFITEFCVAAVKNEPNWHYSMNRPFKLDINPSAASISSDCSGFVVQAVDYARRKVAGLRDEVYDPSKYDFKGYGNTDDDEDGWPHISSPFRVGDLAHFANSRHVVICIQAGDRSGAVWASHGREAGPETIRLSTYRTEDFMFVVRPKYIPDPE